jgi:hypothetical protein
MSGAGSKLEAGQMKRRSMEEVAAGNNESAAYQLPVAAALCPSFELVRFVRQVQMGSLCEDTMKGLTEFLNRVGLQQQVGQTETANFIVVRGTEMSGGNQDGHARSDF